MGRSLQMLAAAACAAVPVLAQAPGSLPALVAAAETARPEAQEFRQLRLDGHEVHGAVRDVVRTLRWYPRLRDARVAAAGAGGKPIVWIHALGDLKGFT